MFSQTTPFRRNFESPARDIYTSPNLSKIAQLNERVKTIQTNFEESRAAKREVFQNKMRYVDDRINKVEQQNDQKFRLLAEQLNKIQEEANQETLAKEIKGNQVAGQKFFNQHQQRALRKKENETKMLRQIDEKIQEMKIELFRDRKKREDYEVYKTSEIENRVNDLREQFEQEKKLGKKLDEVSENLIKTFGEEILKFQDLLRQEKKIREEQHNNMLKVLEDLNDSLTSEVTQEKHIREKSEEMLLKLLEDTCQKIESSLLN